MNQQELNNIKGDLYELIQDNYCGEPKQILLQDVEHLFQYIKELQKFKCLPEQKQEMYLLTKTNFGPAAYLKHVQEGYEVVLEDNSQITGVCCTAKQALDSYFDSCSNDAYSDDDFIEDFLVGVEDGTCEFGDSDYAVYVEKCFNSYVFGKGLQ